VAAPGREGSHEVVGTIDWPTTHVRHPGHGEPTHLDERQRLGAGRNDEVFLETWMMGAFLRFGSLDFP
jgi:hypothetical protein